MHGAATWARDMDARVKPPARTVPDERPLRWDLPGGTATLVRWLVEPGGRYGASAVLATVRLGDGTISRLTGGDAPGTLLQIHAPPGSAVTASDWLATVRPQVPAPGTITAERVQRHPAAPDHTFAVPGARFVAFANGGKLLVVAGPHTVHVVNPRSGSEVSVLGPFTKGRGDVTPVAVGADGHHVVVAEGLQLSRVDLRSGRVVFDRCYDRPIDALACDPRGRTIVLAHREGELTALQDDQALWTLTDPVLRSTSAPALAMSGDARHVAICADEACFVTSAGDAASHPERFPITGGPPRAVFPAGHSLRLGIADDVGLTIWNMGPDGVVYLPPGGLFSTTREIVGRIPLGTDAVVFTPDGEYMISVSPAGVRVWDVIAGIAVSVLDSPGGTAVAVSPDGRWIAVADPEAGLATVVPFPDTDRAGNYL